MIIIPEQKLSMLAILNLHEPDTGRAGESLKTCGKWRLEWQGASTPAVTPQGQ
jgi:hypothetical protein